MYPPLAQPLASCAACNLPQTAQQPLPCRCCACLLMQGSYLAGLTAAYFGQLLDLTQIVQVGACAKPAQLGHQLLCPGVVVDWVPLLLPALPHALAWDAMV